MNLKLLRDQPKVSCTLGQISVDGVFECFSIEPPRYFEGVENAHDKCCILPGIYDVVVNESPHLGFETPELVNVPGRADIRIHPANWVVDPNTGRVLLHGCIAPGIRRGECAVWNSCTAFNRLTGRIKGALHVGEKVTIEITY